MPVACVEKLQSSGQRANATTPKALVKPYRSDQTWDYVPGQGPITHNPWFSLIVSGKLLLVATLNLNIHYEPLK
ncbi:MAG TPA: hypothetical protein DCG18_02575 [Richelia sp.]|nr:hypothetical protein [Richelia sp.]